MAESDSTSGETKKKPGNPNFGKGKKNSYYDKATKQEVYSNNITDMKTEPDSTEGEKKSIPKDIFSDVIPLAEVLPLDGEVKTKDYATLKEPTSETGGGGGGNNNNTDTASASDENSDSGESKPGTGTSDAETQKTEAERKTEAEQAIMLGMRGYEKLHDFGQYLTKKDENKLAGEHAAGKINLNMELPLGKGGNTITLNQFIQSYNSSIAENITVSEQFKTEITPPLVRIAIKRGWGLSDEMTVAALLFEDMGTKIGLLVGLLKSCNMILDLSYNQMKMQGAKHEAVRTNTEEEVEGSGTANPDQWHKEGA